MSGIEKLQAWSEGGGGYRFKIEFGGITRISLDGRGIIASADDESGKRPLDALISEALDKWQITKNVIGSESLYRNEDEPSFYDGVK